MRQVIEFFDVIDKAIVLFMADSGLSRVEVINLTWKDVDIQSGLVSVWIAHRSGTGEGQH